MTVLCGHWVSEWGCLGLASHLLHSVYFEYNELEMENMTYLWISIWCLNQRRIAMCKKVVIELYISSLPQSNLWVWQACPVGTGFSIYRAFTKALFIRAGLIMPHHGEKPSLLLLNLCTDRKGITSLTQWQRLEREYSLLHKRWTISHGVS